MQRFEGLILLLSRGKKRERGQKPVCWAPGWAGLTYSPGSATQFWDVFYNCIKQTMDKVQKYHFTHYKAPSPENLKLGFLIDYDDNNLIE